MLKYRCIFLALLALVWVPSIDAQELKSFSLSALGRAAGKRVTVKKQRFYLFKGGLTFNKARVDQLRTAEFLSRDCYYSQKGASAGFLAWLRAGGDRCDSPFCRPITEADLANVCEFDAAYKKGKVPFQKKPALALDWLVTNLDQPLRTGFYQQREKYLEGLGVPRSGSTPEADSWTPISSSITDTDRSVAWFVHIPVVPDCGSDKNENCYLISNLVPVEIGERTYVWACEVNGDPANIGSLPMPLESGKSGNCEVIVRPLTQCEGGTCKK